MLNKYKKVIGWSVINQMLVMASAFVVIKSINHLFGKDVYGEFVFFQSLFSYMLIVCTLGFDKTIIYKLSGASEEKNTLIGNRLVKKTIYISCTALVIVELISLIYIFYSNEGMLLSSYFWILVFSINTLISTVNVLYVSYFQANKYANETQKIEAVNNIIRLLVIGALVIFNSREVHVLGYLIILPTLTSLLLMLKLENYLRVESNIDIEENKLKRNDVFYSLKMMLTKFVHEGVERIDLIMIGIMLSSVALSGYAISAKLASLVLIGNTLMSPLLSPRLKYYLDKNCKDSLKKEYTSNRNFSTLCGLFILLAYCILGEKLLTFFGDFSGSYNLLLLISLAFFNKVSFGPNGRVLMLSGHANYILITTLGTLLVLLILNYCMIPVFGVVGAAAGTYIGLLFLNITTQVLMARELPNLNSTKYYIYLLMINISVFIFITI